jgi:hypothetical protein
MNEILVYYVSIPFMIVTVDGALLCNVQRIKTQFRYNLQSEGRKVGPLAGEIT